QRRRRRSTQGRRSRRIEDLTRQPRPRRCSRRRQAYVQPLRRTSALGQRREPSAAPLSPPEVPTYVWTPPPLWRVRQGVRSPCCYIGSVPRVSASFRCVNQIPSSSLGDPAQRTSAAPRPSAGQDGLGAVA